MSANTIANFKTYNSFPVEITKEIEALNFNNLNSPYVIDNIQDIQFLEKLTNLDIDTAMPMLFQSKEFVQIMEKLLELLQAFQMQTKKNNTPTLEKPQHVMPCEKEVFLEKIQKVIEENMSNPNLNVTLISKALNLSKHQLFRKIKSATGESPVNFILKTRLQKGLKLLRSNYLNISEIAYKIGFNDPNYFSRAFKKEFGETPSWYRKRNAN